MSALAKYWKLVLAALLAAAALAVFLLLYLPERDRAAERIAQLGADVAQLQLQLAEAARYPEGAEEDVAAAMAELEASRLELYRHFPAELREEDQLLYLLGLGDQFGGGGGELGFSTDLRQVFLEKFNVDITYTFGTPAALLALSDGSLLQGQTVMVYYSGGYGDVKEMIRYLGEEAPSITSIQFADMRWLDGEVTGTFTLLNYVLDSGLLEYQEPAVEAPETGKTNIFE